MMAAAGSIPPELDELLAAHAAGNLPPPVALIVGTHLALSPASQRRHRLYEAVGGALLEGIAPAPVAPDAWGRLLARLDDGDRAPAPPPPPPPPGPLGRIPRPLRDHLGDSLDRLPWYRNAGAAQAELDLAAPGYRTTLIRVPAGRPYAEHDHAGTELILTLEGGFRDGAEHHRRGDLVVAGPDVHHAPVAAPGEDWLWLRVLDAPLRRSGLAGRLLDRVRRL